MTAKIPLIHMSVPQHQEINLSLKAWLLSLAKEIPDRVSNLPGGKPLFESKWLSDTGLHMSEQPELVRLRQVIERAASRSFSRNSQPTSFSVSSMWSIISKPGLTGVPHDHVGQVSCAYYVDVGSVGEKDGGLLHFYANGPSKPVTHTVHPKSGHLYLFASSLYHSVSCYTGKEPRIVISANLR